MFTSAPWGVIHRQDGSINPSPHPFTDFTCSEPVVWAVPAKEVHLLFTVQNHQICSFGNTELPYLLPGSPHSGKQVTFETKRFLRTWTALLAKQGVSLFCQILQPLENLLHVSVHAYSLLQDGLVLHCNPKQSSQQDAVAVLEILPWGGRGGAIGPEGGRRCGKQFMGKK